MKTNRLQGNLRAIVYQPTGKITLLRSAIRIYRAQTVSTRPT